MNKYTRETAENDTMLTVAEVATALRVDDTTVRRWIKTGALPAITLPHAQAAPRQAYRVRRADLDNVLNKPAV